MSLKDIHFILNAQQEMEESISADTNKNFSNHLKLLRLQHDLLFDFLVNYYEYGTLKNENPSQFFVCYALFSDCLRKQKIATKLIITGYYDEAAELIRHVMQTSFTIRYLAENKQSWPIWLQQQKANDDRVLDESIENPRTIFYKFRELLRGCNSEDNYPLFRKLSGMSHPSGESIRSSFELSNEEASKHYFTRRYNAEKAEYLLSYLYSFVNEAFWRGINKLVLIEGGVPRPLHLYKECQKFVQPTFDKVYNPVHNES